MPMPLQEYESQKHPAVYNALLAPKRIQALKDCDRNLISYDPTSFLLVFRLRGRNFRLICLPLASLLVWDILWGLLLITSEDHLEIRDEIQNMQGFITPILTPVSFLLVFRLGRAAVRYWDARAAMGKIIEVCRTTASSALVGCCPVNTSSSEKQLQQQQLAEEFMRWIAVFPLAVKNFLRPWEASKARTMCNRSDEIGEVLSPKDRKELLATKGESLYAPVLVLNRIRQLAYQLAYSTTKDSLTPRQDNAVMGGVLFRQLNEQIDTLTAAWGAMERINGTPLPFVYVAHLRTFLLLYLFLWHMEAIAVSGWIALLPLLLTSWGLLGIEAAAVECERPFQWNSNHLALGKACIVVARNLAQTWDNLGYAKPLPPAKVATPQDRLEKMGTVLQPIECTLALDVAAESEVNV